MLADPALAVPEALVGVELQVLAQALDGLAHRPLEEVGIGFVFVQALVEGFVEVNEGLDVGDLALGGLDDQVADLILASWRSWASRAAAALRRSAASAAAPLSSPARCRP